MGLSPTVLVGISLEFLVVVFPQLPYTCRCGYPKFPDFGNPVTSSGFIGHAHVYDNVSFGRNFSMMEQYDYNQTILMMLYVLMTLAIPGAMILLDNGKMKRKEK